jgi:hypothetical protein
LSLTKSDPVYSPLMSPSPAIIDLLLSDVILRDLAWVSISYAFVHSKSLRPTYFRALIYKINGPSICQCQWLFLGEPKQSGLALIWVIWYTFTSRKSLTICTWSSAPYTVTEKLSCIIKGPMKVISELFPETWGYFCMNNWISTTRNCHSHIHESTHFILFASLKVNPRCFPLFGVWAP